MYRCKILLYGWNYSIIKWVLKVYLLFPISHPLIYVIAEVTFEGKFLVTETVPAVDYIPTGY